MGWEEWICEQILVLLLRSYVHLEQTALLLCKGGQIIVATSWVVVTYVKPCMLQIQAKSSILYACT